MKVDRISGPPSLALARALTEFEVPFTYPLGPEKFFRISHGEDYTLFFRAQGEGSCFIAENQGRVVGTLGTSIRRLLLPNGNECAAAYMGDLKIAAEARGGTVLVRLARAAEKWLRPRVVAAFGVVMGGTTLSPEAYTGRAGIPGFQELGRVIVLRIAPGNGAGKSNLNHLLTTGESGLGCYRDLSRGRYACGTGDPQVRSQLSAMWLMDPAGSACGMLEDTRKAKRLILDDGSEMLSAHLSCFACRTVPAGARLIECALEQAVRLGLPALFVSVAEADAPELKKALRNFEVLAAPATIYGAGLAAGHWNINTADI